MKRDPRIEVLARRLAQAAGWIAPGNDENTLVTRYQQEALDVPGIAYSVPKGAFPVWQAYVGMAETALAWLDDAERRQDAAE